MLAYLAILLVPLPDLHCFGWRTISLAVTQHLGSGWTLFSLEAVFGLRCACLEVLGLRNLGQRKKHRTLFDPSPCPCSQSWCSWGSLSLVHLLGRCITLPVPPHPTAVFRGCLSVSHDLPSQVECSTQQHQASWLDKQVDPDSFNSVVRCNFTAQTMP